MASGFSFGAAAPQPQQQQQQPLFGVNPTTPSFGAPPAATASRSFFGAAPATSATTGFSFSTPATSQAQPQQTGFSLSGGLAAPTTSAPGIGAGFSFGSTTTTAAATVPPSAPLGVTSGTSLGGLGGIPSTGGPRLSTLAFGAEPITGWSARNDNRAVQELPVPPEILAAVEELKNHMKIEKTIIQDLNRTSCDMDIDMVIEQIEEVRASVCNLISMMHKQEIQSASIVKDVQDVGKDVELLSQCREIPSFEFGGSNLLINFLMDLVNRYRKRMEMYKQEIERAESSLQTLTDTGGMSAKDLWDSLSSTRDLIVVMSARVQELHEQYRNELLFHRGISQLLFGHGEVPKWITVALSGDEVFEEVPPLDRAFSSTSAVKPGPMPGSNVESVVKRTYSMFNRTPSHIDQRVHSTPSTESFLRIGAHDLRSPAYSPPYHPSAMGSYLGPSSPSSNPSLKRSKK